MRPNVALYGAIACATLLVASFADTSRGTPQSPPPVAITGIRFYAWHWDGEQDEDTYHELTEFPVGDDHDEYPTFDVVAALANHTGQSAGPYTAEVTLTYQVGPRPADEEPASYDWAKKRATWRKPEWTKKVEVGALDPEGTRRVRLAVIPVAKDLERFGKREQWPYRARFDVVLRETRKPKSPALSHLRRELSIDMLD